MISKYAVEAFLNRQTEQFDWIKTLTEDQLDYELAQLLPPVHFHTKPRLHQKACFLLGTLVPEFLYFLDLGTGKTKLVLDLLRYGLLWGHYKCALIVVPQLTNVAGWLEQIAEHAPDLTVVALEGSSAGRWRTLQTVKAHGFVIAYASLVAMTSRKIVDGRTGKTKMVPDPEAIRKLAELFDVVAADECQAIKSHRSLTFKILSALAQKAKARFGLTGTPFGRKPEDLWAQFKFIDHGKTLGTTLGIFRAAFFKEEINYWGGYEYEFKSAMEPQLAALIKNRSICYTEKECGDVPAVVPIHVPIPMPDEYRPYYRAIVEKLKEAQSDLRLRESAFMNLRQLSSGFLNTKDEDGSERIVMAENPKLDYTMGLVDSLPKGCKLVIFHEFTFTGDVICGALKERKVKYVRLSGQTKDAKEELRRFKFDDRYEVAVIISKVGAAGLNLQRANYQVFYECPVSAIVRQQAEKRCARTGQERKVFIYDLLMQPGIDRRILEFTQEGKSMLARLVKGEELLAEL